MTEQAGAAADERDGRDEKQEPGNLPEPEPQVVAAEAPVEAPAPEEPKTEAAKPEEAAAEAAKREEPAAEAAKPEEAAAEAAKPEEAVAEAAKPGEATAEGAKAEEGGEAPKVEEPPVEEAPKVEEPPPPPVPSIESVEPDHGPVCGGAKVLVRGSALAEGCQVLIGGVEAAVVRKDETTLEVETPAGAKKGLVELRVVNPDGQVALYEEDFRYDPVPTIVGVEPVTVPTEGGTVITILGADFVQGCSVRLGGELVPSSWANAGRLEAVSKRHAAGAGDVEVENPDKGRAVRERAVRFAAPPRVDEIEPASAVAAGGITVTIRGSGFEAGSTVVLAGTAVEGTELVSESEIRFTAPPHIAAEAVEVAVVNPSGLVHRRPAAFTYFTAPPRLSSVDPDRGPSAGGTELVLRGEDFEKGTAVFVCGIAAAVAFKSREELRAVTPPVPRDGLVEVRVVNSDGQAFTLEKAFRYVAALPPPELRQVSPARGSQLGGLKVAVLGENLAEGLSVRFGGVPAAVRYLTGKEVEATTPVFNGYGEVAVEVVNPDGASSTLDAAFFFEPRPAPEIAGITPTSGPTTGGTKVLIEGKNFTRESQVYVGREHPKDIVFKSASELQIVTAPRKQAGVVDVEVSSPGAPKAVMKNGFRYDAVPAPVITSVSPTAGAVGGGTEMTVSGKNFLKETVVLVDGKAPKTVKLVDASTLEFKTPPGDAGKMVDVVVKNPDGKEAVQKRAFLYDPRYRG